MLVDVYNFANKGIKEVKEQAEFDLEPFLSTKISLMFLNMHFTRMKKYNFIPKNHTKTIPEISGTTAKPHRQKGLGRSRQGTRRAAQHRGGVKIFGPQALKRKIGLPKAEVKLAKRMLLKIAYEKQKVFIINDCVPESAKTKDTLNNIKPFLPSKDAFPNVLIIHHKEVAEDNLLAIRNLKRAKYAESSTFTVNDLLKCNTIMITKSGLTNLLTTLA